MTTEDRIQLLKDIRVSSPYVDEDKRLLVLKDICGRLPYGVIGLVHNANGNEYNISITGGDIDLFSHQFINIKHYLRSMESMTDDEYEELCSMRLTKFIGDSKEIDYLDKKMFDYRGLIPMGLALEAPEGMYNN